VANGPAGSRCKTIADFRKDNGPAIRKVVRTVCDSMSVGLLTTPSATIDGSKFKAVNNRDKNFTRAKTVGLRGKKNCSPARTG
jgi:transposase